MMRTRSAAVGRLVLAVSIVVGPPLVLARLVGWPLPSWPVDVDVALEALSVGAVPATAWIRLAATAAWVTWAVLIGLMALELVAVLRERPSARYTPVVVRQWAQSLVAAVLVLSTPSMASAAPATTPWVRSAPAPAPSPSTASVSVAEDGTHVEVVETDSWAGWAGEALGDPTLGPLIREANIGRDVGGHTVDGSELWVEEGWRLLIPTASPGPRATSVPGADLDETPQRSLAGQPDAASADSHVVAPGDSLWKIADERLGDAHAWTSLWDANAGTTMADGRTFSDPDLIHPGWVLEFQPPTASRVAAIPAAVDEGVRPSPAGPSASSIAQGVPALPSGVEVSDAGPTAEDREVNHGTGDGVAAGPEEAPGSVDEQPEEGEVGGEEVTAWGTPAGLSAGAAAALLAASGIVPWLRRRRRQAQARRGSGLRMPTPAPDTVEALAPLVRAAADEEPVESLAALLRTLPEDVQATVVWWEDDGTVVIAFDDDPSGQPPAPWQCVTVGGRATWRATLGMSGDERSWGLPLLATVGRSEGRTIAVNLAVVQHLSVAGADDLVEVRLRAMAMEVATSPLSGPLEVVVSRDDLDTFDRVRRVAHLQDVVAESVAEHDGGLIGADRTPRLLVAGLHDVAPHLPDEVAGFVGTIARDGRPGWQLQVASATDGVLHLPDGARLPVALPAVPADAILDEAERVGQVAPLDGPDDLDDDRVDTAVTEPAIPPPRHGDVRLLGPVEVIVGGERLSLAPKTLDVLCYLATHRDGVEVGRLEEAVWAGAASADTGRVRTQLAKLRSLLGSDPDGQPMIPPRTTANKLIRLGEGVGSDIDRVLTVLHASRHADVEVRRRAARAVLELVRGAPFDGLGAPEWAAEIEHVTIARLQDEALWLAAHDREAHRWDDARWAVKQGLALFGLAEQLWGEWLRIEAAIGDADEVRRVMGRARKVLAADADEVTGTTLGPSPDLEELYGELLSA